MPITIPTVDQILGDLQNRFEQFFGVDNFNIAPSTPNGQIVRIWTHALYQSYQTLQYAYQSSRYNQAIGADLDNLLSLLGIIRRSGNVTFNAVSLTGLAGSTVPAGSLASAVGMQRNYLFYLTTDVILDENGNGTGIFMQEFNQILTENSFAAGALNKVVSIIKNETGQQIWTAVHNPNASQLAGGSENDDSLRRRSSLFISRFSTGYLSTIRSAVLTTTGARNVQVFENVSIPPLSEPIFPPGLPLHNILVCGYWVPTPTQGSTLVQQIGDQIAEVLPPTTAWDASGTTLGEDRFSIVGNLPTGQKINVGFITAVQRKFGCWVFLRRTSNLLETRNRILNLLWDIFDNPTAFDNSGSVDPSRTRGFPIGTFFDYNDFRCRIIELGRDGLFEVLNVFISSNWNGTATPITTWTEADILSDNFDDVLLFNDESDPNTGPLPEGTIRAPQLTIEFQAANGVN